jgi:serine/threonine protein kinase/Tfp pilus assembly protein PilF
MQSPSQQISTCPNCGGVIEQTPSGEPGCIFCLLQAGIGSEKETAQDLTPAPLDGGVRFGVYEIDCHADGNLCELGRGAMGVTYRATDTSLQRKVALKIIKTDIAERSADARERFVREARAAAALRHECIATVYQFGVRLETGQYFYAMELIEGETLEERVRRAGPLDSRTTIGIAEQVTSALAAAEKQGLVHRDLKPGNIMLVNPDAPEVVGSDQARSKQGRIRALRKIGIPVVKIIDFGLAKAFQSATDPKSLTHDKFVGTPAFASPEQIEHSALDVRSDIYSLGETLWFALTGKTPFTGRTLTEILRAQKSNVLPSEQLKVAHVPRRLKSLLESMLAFEPASRPGTQELAARLQRCSPEASSVRRTRAGLAAAFTLILGATGFFAFRSLHTQNLGLNPPVAEKSIAVLPFENRSEEKANAYFAEGIQDEILTRLAKIADLRVISRMSTQDYNSAPTNLPEIARQLGVAHILEGSVQKSGDAVRVNVQLIKAASDSHLWADTFDRKLTDIFSVESEVAKAIADQLQAKLTGEEEQVIAAKPTNNVEAYDAYLRGLAYTLRHTNYPTNLRAQKFLKEAVRLDPKFALAWALLASVDADGYIALTLQPTVALREEARQAAETALTLHPNLGEAILAKGYYHYACLRDYDSAVRYYEQARQFLPNSARIPELLAYVVRRQDQWERSEFYFNEAERLDPRNAVVLSEHALHFAVLRRFPEALRKFDQLLNITPDDIDILAEKAAIAQAEGDLPRAAALLASLDPNTDLIQALEQKVYQAILERRPRQVIPRLEEILAKPDPALGFFNGELRFWLGWAQDIGGDHTAAEETWRQGRSELESFVKEQPENYQLMRDLALTNTGLGDKAAAFAWVERAMALLPIDKDAASGPGSVETLARVAAQMGESDRAISALQKLLSIPYVGALAEGLPLTPALLQLDPMFDPLRNDPRFKKLVASPAPK